MIKTLKDRFNRICERKADGSMAIEAVICTMIFLLIFCAVLDMTMVKTRNSAMTDIGKELARTISVQGGARNTPPQGYASNYYTMTALANLVKGQMEAAGFKDGEWSVSIEYNSADPTSTQFNTKEPIMYFADDGSFVSVETDKIDYLTNFSITITGKYDWVFLKSFIGKQTGYTTFRFPGTSEVKWDYDAWGSEI